MARGLTSVSTRSFPSSLRLNIFLSQPFDYTEWRKKNLCAGMSVEEISNAAVEYGKKRFDG